MPQLIRQIIILALCLAAVVTAKIYVSRLLDGAPQDEQAADSDIEPTAGTVPEVTLETAQGRNTSDTER